MNYQSSSNVRTWCMVCHLAALSSFFFSLGAVLGPLIVWMIKRDEMPEIIEHGKEAVNFQLTIWAAYFIAAIALAGTMGFSLLFGFGFVGLGSGFAIGIILFIVRALSWVLAIVAGIKANNGEFYRYPFSIRFIR